MSPSHPLLRTLTPLWFLRLAAFSAALLAVTGCVPGQDNGNGAGGPPCGQAPGSQSHHKHKDWDDDKGSNHKEWDDDKGYHHHEWDDAHGKHHHVYCDDRGNHYHDFDDDKSAHHHRWCDDRNHVCHDWDDNKGHHHDGDDDDHHGSPSGKPLPSDCTKTSTSTSTGTTTTTSTSTNTSTYAFPDLPGRTCTVDTFHQSTDTTQYVKKLDLLFVMDHSGSMADDWQRVATNIENLVQQLPATTDIRYAVVLGDVGAWSGKLYAPFNQAYLDNQKLSSAQIAQALQQTFAAGMKVSDAGSGEALFYSLYKAVTTQASANQKAGFFRPDAALSVLFMSDEQEVGFPFPSRATLAAQGLPYRCDEQFEDGVKAQYYDRQGVTLDVTFNAVKALKGTMPIKMNAFINVTKADLFLHNDAKAKCLYDSIGYGYPDMVAKTKGVLYSIQADKAEGLKQCGEAIAKSLELQHDFNLSHPASEVDPATILNAVDGALVDGTYSAANNSEHLENSGVAGSTIQVRYCAPVVIPQWSVSAFAGVPSQTSVGLSWLTLEYATSGKVMWGTSANALVNEADDANVTANHALTVNGLAPNTTYYFQATSWIGGTSRTSPVIAVTTLPQWAISGVAAQPSRTGASIQWNTAEYPTSGYVNWGLAATALTNQSVTAAVGNSHTVTLSGLQPATTYYYQVLASDGLGQSQSSAVLSFTTAADWGISGFTGAATRTTVTLDWQTLDQVTNGAILWGRSSALGNTANENAGAANDHQVVVSGLTPDTDYYFEVLATDPNGLSKTSNMILVHTAVDWSIGGFAGTSTQNSVTVSWTTSGYATNGAVGWGSDATLGHSVADTVTGTTHTVTISGLNPDTLYYFQAASVDTEGVSKSSTTVAIRTQPVPLPVWAISNFAGTSTTSSVTLGWQTAQYATSGTVLYGTDLAALTSQQADTVTGVNHSMTISGLAAGTTYYFQVVASDDRGQTQSSDVIQIKTMSDVVTPPANWTIVGFDGTTTASQANLIWQTPGADTTATVAVGLAADDLTLMTLQVSTAAQTHQLAMPGLSPNTQYFFQVTATDTSGVTHQSVVIQKTTKAQ